MDVRGVRKERGEEEREREAGRQGGREGRKEGEGGWGCEGERERFMGCGI